MPGGARAGLEGHDAAADAGRRGCLEPGVNAHGASEVVGRARALDGCDPARVTVII